jgi:hypothetical protein
MRGARAFSLCSFKKHTISFKNIPIFKKKKKIIPLPLFPPSLRLKKTQAKPASLMRQQVITWQDLWRSHAPRGASKNPDKDFCSEDLNGVVCRRLSSFV